MTRHITIDMDVCQTCGRSLTYTVYGWSHVNGTRGHPHAAVPTHDLRAKQTPPESVLTAQESWDKLHAKP